MTNIRQHSAGGSPGPWRAAPRVEDSYFDDVNILRPDGLAVAVAVQNGDILPSTAAHNGALIAAAVNLVRAMAAAEVSWKDQLAAAERELGLRKRVYPRRVDKGQMTPAMQAREIRAMESIIATLKPLADTEDLFG